MNVRIGAVCLFGFALVLGGCAGGSAPQAVQPQAVADEDLPVWVLALPEGELPRDNNETGRAALFLAQGLFEQALEAAQAGIQLDSSNAQSYLQAGQAYIGLGDYANASSMFDQAVGFHPRSVLEANFYREAQWIETYNEAVTFMPGDIPSAIAALERANTIYQDRPEAMVQLGALYSQEGQPEQALEMFLQAVEMIEGPVGQREEDPEAIASLEENLEASRFNLGQLFFELERYAEAAEVYEILVNENPDDLMAYSNLGAALVGAGNSQRASEVYGELLARPSLTVTDYNAVAIGAYNGDLFVLAAQAFGRAHEALPQNRDFIFNQAQALYLAEEEQEKLVDVATRLVEIDTHNRNARQFLIQALIGLERVEEAAEVLNELESLAFDIEGLQLVAVEGGYTLPGVVTNRTADPGSTANIRFRFFDANGLEVGVQDVSLLLEEVEVGLEFEVEFPTTAEVIGYNYEVLN